MAQLQDVIAKLQEQDGKLDAIGTSVNGVVGDIGSLKDLIAQLQAGSVSQEQIDALNTLADNMGSKIGNLATITADLDAQTA